MRRRLLDYFLCSKAVKSKLSLLIKQLREIKRTCGDIEVDVVGFSLTGLVNADNNAKNLIRSLCHASRDVLQHSKAGKNAKSVMFRKSKLL